MVLVYCMTLLYYLLISYNQQYLYYNLNTDNRIVIVYHRQVFATCDIFSLLRCIEKYGVHLRVNYFRMYWKYYVLLNNFSILFIELHLLFLQFNHSIYI